MSVTSYHTVRGRILGETTAGDRMDYLSDALGSVTATASNAGVVQNRYRYKPYGARLSKVGSAPDSKFQWVGQRGYRTFPGRDLNYVRSRHYSSVIASWTSTDSIISWPKYRSSFSYVRGKPTGWTDSSGNYLDYDEKTCGSSSPGRGFCDTLAGISDEDLFDRIAKCMKGKGQDKVFSTHEQALVRRTLGFLRRACFEASSPRICVFCGFPDDYPCSTAIHPCDGAVAFGHPFNKDAVLPPAVPEPAPPSHGKDYLGRSIHCKFYWGGSCDELLRKTYPNCDCMVVFCEKGLTGDAAGAVLAHELMHCAGIEHLLLTTGKVDKSDFVSRLGCCLCRVTYRSKEVCGKVCAGVKDVHPNPLSL